MGRTTSAPVLSLDTSGSFCSVALRAGDGVVVHRESEGQGDHFERLPLLVREVLTESEYRASDLGAIRVGIGPGSFTGLRIGMSFAKGLSVAAGVPLSGVSSLDGVAWTAFLHNGLGAISDILTISDARRNEVFMAEYRVYGDTVNRSSTPAIAPLADVAVWCEGHPAGVVVTPVVNFLIPGDRTPLVGKRIAEGLLHADPGGRLGFSLSDVALLEPEYLRAVSAKSIAERG